MTRIEKSLTGETKVIRSDMKFALDYVTTEFVLALWQNEKAIRGPLRVTDDVKTACRVLARADPYYDSGYDQKLADVAVSALMGLASRQALRMTPSFPHTTAGS